MSGVEAVAGLALGVLPLLISAAEHYDQCLRPFLRYKNFAKEADHFRHLLGVQKTIFRNQCRILLEEIIEHDTASSILDTTDPLSIQNAGLEQQLSQLLGESKEACITTTELMRQRLREVEGESHELWSILDEDDKGIQDNACHKAWRRRVAKKLRFSFSKPRLDLILSDLRSLNDDFRTLSSQTIKSSPSQPRSIPIVPADACNDVEKYKVIGQASRQVYEALGKACTKHTEHQAHFCIEVEQVIINERHGAQVKFNMAFTHLTLTGATDQGDLIWFVVESSTGDHMTLACSGAATDCTERLTQTLKRNLDPVSEAVQKKVKKSVRFDSSVISQTCMPIPPTATLMKALSSDNNVRKDFCDFLRQRMRQQTQADVCLGVLQHTESCRNFVYPPRPRSCSQGRQVTSLGRLISSMTKHKDVGRFSLYDRIHLAKMLAIAVLQYHATPWLRASWRSDDVYFFGTDDSPSTQHLLDLSSPHLNVKVKGPDGQLSRASTFPPHTLARNPLLFSLGVVLLELAHTSTLESLQRPIDLEDGHENRYTEFFLARRLAKLRSSDMGINYHKVVERLVECDFGCGTDLSEPQLQTAFYKDVIYPLESLQKKLHDFHLDC